MNRTLPQTDPAHGTSAAEGPPSAGAAAQRFEECLAGWMAERPLPRNLHAALEYVLLAGGKRVRPMLVLRSCEAVGGDPELALPSAVAMELVHNFSLVHDDLPAMDDDDLRRGRPTLHKHANEAMAILAGDAMLGLAFELLAAHTPDAARAGSLCRELAVATNDMIAGQVYDTLPEEGDDTPDLERLQRIHRNKTEALIRGSCRMGAISGGASDDQLEAMTRYGAAVGLMFQVVDDVLDVTQSTEHLGKTARKDVEQGKLTYPAVLGIEESRREVERLRRDALEASATFGPAAEPLRELCDWLAVRTK